MSKIFDALRKAEAETQVERPPAIAITPEASRLCPGESLGKPFPESMRAEMATLRNSIELVLPRNNKVIAFAGAVRGEGASTLATAYARFVSSEFGLRILLVDGDLTGERDTLSHAASSQEPGLLQVVSDGTPIAAALRGIEGESFQFLPSGGRSLQTLQVFSSDRLRAILRELGNAYDVTVIDSAPVTLYPEVPVLLSQADGVVLVIQSERTRREAAQRAMSRLSSAGCNVVGAVMNRRRNVVPGFLYRRV
jgi:Mrp family chromosome partitioning ATPase